MKQNLTEIVFILDRSGSMSGMEADTIGGFNSLIEKQKKEKGEAIISTVLFDNQREVLHNRVCLNRIKPMTEEEYYVRGSTALLDAVGFAIDHIINVRRHTKKEYQPAKIMFVIMTDGYENASTNFSYRDIRRMIEHQKERYHWQFMFVGANMDAIGEASKYGIDADMAVEYHCDRRGTAVSYDAICGAVSAVRACGAVPMGWKNEVEKDRKSRRRER
ncbi:MAG: VWA domain-containing protein [Anaerotignum sp.]|nr:VWA domain-containing protein [Anaerotignum sp.]